MTIETLDNIEDEIDALAEILHQCVLGGASVNFILPFSMEDARAWWRKVQGSIVFVARIDGEVVGTVTLAPAKQPNQPHRADVAKLLVHPKARKRGVASALMKSLEERALVQGRTLLCLDTNSGDDAERLYHALGYTLLGKIPGFSIPTTGGEPKPASFFYKELAVRG
jgi:GNAT superfamily N-acetyltransferase